MTNEFYPGAFRQAQDRKLKNGAEEYGENNPTTASTSMPRPGESTTDWFNRWRAEQHQAPIPERIMGEDGKAETKLRTFQLSDVAWHGLMALALDFGYVKGTTNNPNVTKLLETIGQGKLVVASAYGGPGLSAPSLDE